MVVIQNRVIAIFLRFSAPYTVTGVPKLSYKFKSTPSPGCKILSWCVNWPHSYPQENSTRLLGFNYPAPRPLPSNTAHLPAVSLLPSIPNKPEIAVLLIRFGRKQKKYHPFFQSSPNQKKGWAAVWSNQNSRREGRTAAGTRATKKDWRGNSRQPFKLNHFKIVSCLYSISSSAVLFPL